MPGLQDLFLQQASNLNNTKHSRFVQGDDAETEAYVGINLIGKPGRDHASVTGALPYRDGQSGPVNDGGTPTGGDGAGTSLGNLG